MPTVVVPSGSPTGGSFARLLERGVAARRLVHLDALDRHDLLREETRVGGGDRPLVRAKRPGVLILTADAELPGDERRLLDHVPTVERRDEPVVEHRVDQVTVPHPVAEPCLRQEIRGLGHRLHPAGDHDLLVAGPDHLVGDRDGAHPGRTHLVQRLRADLARQPGRDLSLTRRDLAGSRLDDLAHDDVPDIRVGNSRALEGGPHRPGSQLDRGEAREATGKLPERGARRSENDARRHARSVPAGLRVDARGRVRIR